MEMRMSNYDLMVMMIMTTMMVAVQSNQYKYDDPLSYSYYHKKCPDMEKIIHNTIYKWIKNDTTIAPAIMRLHFHDCIVRGCDASILLNHEGSERASKASTSLRGFELINEIKTAIEKKCPKTVSCADILTAAARDATVAVGGPFWQVPYGRKDGRVSVAKEADSVPMGHERITDLIELYQSKGLTMLDLVVLSGAHTIGRSTCGSLQGRLYNYKGTRKPDPSIHPRYLNFLRRKCRWASEYVELDGVTPTKFDVQYYRNLQNKMGLLATDQMLYSDSRTGQIVTALASQSGVFEHQFAASMVKLGNILDASIYDDGEIRHNCNYVN